MLVRDGLLLHAMAARQPPLRSAIVLHFKVTAEGCPRTGNFTGEGPRGSRSRLHVREPLNPHSLVRLPDANSPFQKGPVVIPVWLTGIEIGLFALPNKTYINPCGTAPVHTEGRRNGCTNGHLPGGSWRRLVAALRATGSRNISLI